MSGVEEFEALLKEVVQARRLSASKMTKLTEIAMAHMEHDTQLVSVLYRTHKSLSTSFKISSLYVFDALARAAKHQTNKQKLVLDEPQAVGNAATFLSKLGGVVDGLFQDMQSLSVPEGKEKTKKVLDLWIKGNTFPPELLSRLRDILKGTEKASETNLSLGVSYPKPEYTAPTPSAPTIPPPPMSPTISQSAPAPAMDAQVTLLALLAQAANAGSVVPTFPQTDVNTPAAQFATAQFVLQQLAQSAAAPALNIATPPLVSAPSGNDLAAGPHRRSRSPIPDDPRRPPREAIRQERYYSPENGRTYDSQSDHRPFARAPTRGNFRGRGSGDRRRWDDRDRDPSYRDRAQERDWSPRRGGRSRSRSPLRHGDKRSEKPSSPRRSSNVAPSWANNRRPEPAPTASGRDEFGRDIRPPSPDPINNSNSTEITSIAISTPTSALPTPYPASTTPRPTTVDTTDREPSNTSNSNTHDAAEIMSAEVAPITSTANGNASSSFVPNTTIKSASGAPQGMDEFDFSTFDLRSPASWEALGKMWQVTYGCAPTDEQLMQFVMSMGTIRPGVDQGAGQQQGQQHQRQQQQQWLVGEQQQYQGSGYVRGGRVGRGGRGGYGAGRGRGAGFSHGNARFGQHNQWGYNDQETDAIVLGGGDSPGQAVHDSYSSMDVEIQPPPQSGGGGKMQKVGDKWVFTRTES